MRVFRNATNRATRSSSKIVTRLDTSPRPVLSKFSEIPNIDPLRRRGSTVGRDLAPATQPQYRHAFPSLLVTTVRFESDSRRIESSQRLGTWLSRKHSPSYTPLCPDTSLTHSQTPHVESSIDSCELDAVSRRDAPFTPSFSPAFSATRYVFPVRFTNDREFQRTRAQVAWFSRTLSISYTRASYHPSQPLSKTNENRKSQPVGWRWRGHHFSRGPSSSDSDARSMKNASGPHT